MEVCASSSLAPERTMMMVDVEYIACRQCASQCYASHHDEISNDDHMTCEQREASCSTKKTSTYEDHLNTHISLIFRRPHIAPSFICVVSPAMLPHNQPFCYMRFPKSFADCNLSKCVGEAKLKGPSGWLWHAHFQKLRDSMVLGSPGWTTFAQDHSLEEGDMLVFTYTGRNAFKVRIFGLKEGHMEKGKECMPSTTKHLCDNAFNVNVQGKAFCENAFNENAHDKTLCANAYDKNLHDRASMCVDAIHENVPDKTLRANAFNENVHDTILCDNTFNVDVHDKITYKEPKPLSQSTHINQEEGQGSCFPSISTRFPCAINFNSETPQEIALKRAKAIHETVACKLSNPTVTKLLATSAVHGDFKLVFPMPFVKMHMPSKNVIITFVDPSNKSWRCNWLGEARTRERLYVCGGWQPFVREHTLKTNDVCIFELVDKHALCFHVHIFKS